MNQQPKEKQITIGVIGLGYVGLPLSCLFARRYEVVGYDVSATRVDELNAGVDSTQEVTPAALARALATRLTCTTDKTKLAGCNVFVVSVPTPVDCNHIPDLAPLAAASRVVGEFIPRGGIAIYESTVYPGMTEEFCAPIIEQVSGLTLNDGFFIGYSPERINPGDKDHTVENIRKITSGSTPQIARVIDHIYDSVLLNGTYRAPSIKVAEAAKIMENTQRDVNIAFMNEMMMVFNAMGVDVNAVREAAGTKWNYLPFSPGLVGGHCIGVDPYYLIQRAKAKGVYPRLVTEARRVNEAMGKYVGDRIVHSMDIRDIPVHGSNILLLGFTFKENCPDIRNTKVFDVFNYLRAYTPNVQVYDPWVSPEAAWREYGVPVDTHPSALQRGKYDAVVHCVKHDCFRDLLSQPLWKTGGVFFDMFGFCSNPDGHKPVDVWRPEENELDGDSESHANTTQKNNVEIHLTKNNLLNIRYYEKDVCQKL